MTRHILTCAGRGVRRAAASVRTALAIAARGLDRAFPSLIIVLALLMGLQFVVQSRRDRDASACRAQFTRTLRESLDARAKLSTASDDNQNALILAVTSLVLAKPPKDAAETKARGVTYRQIFVDFREHAAAIALQRKQNPIPELPDC